MTNAWISNKELAQAMADVQKISQAIESKKEADEVNLNLDIKSMDTTHNEEGRFP